MLPEIIKKFLIDQRKGQGFFCIEMNEKLNIIQYFGKAKEFGVNSPQYDMYIGDYLPVLLTESFDKNFEVPFYNISDNHVCHVYFLKSKKENYLVLIDKSEIFFTTQKYQQFAHNDNIAKNKFKRLSEDLEIAKNQLKRSNQEKATLIAMLSHELGTPLTSILGYSELLMNNDINVEKGLKIINRNAIYLKQMIENTLLFGRTEAGGVQVHLEEISINNLLNSIKSIIQPPAEEKGLKFQIDFRNSETLYIDITRTKQILINLLNNAVKYTDEGFIELRFSVKGENYVFSVVDSGIGIPKVLQKTIFNPWERVEESSATGAGIGLFISKKLAHAIGAELILKHSSKEIGSIFQLIIPIQSKAKLEQTSQEEAQTICKGKTILIIDDDPDILDLIDAFLDSSGLTVFTALDMLKAKVILKKNKIDIILTDYNIGGTKADIHINKIKANNNLPVILMTALPSNQNNKKYKALGFDAVLPKPIDSLLLIQTITLNLKMKS